MGRCGQLKRQERTAILVLTNGERTEMAYLKGIKQLARGQNISLTFRSLPGDPKTLLRKLQTPAVATSDYDEAWGIVDEDGADRSDFARALEKAGPKSNGQPTWRAIISRPCFEVWLVAHYEQVLNYQNQAEAQRHFDKIVGKRPNRKLLPKDFPFESYVEASKRCQLVGAESSELRVLPPLPGTHMAQLVFRLLGGK